MKKGCKFGNKLFYTSNISRKIKCYIIFPIFYSRYQTILFSQYFIVGTNNTNRVVAILFLHDTCRPIIQNSIVFVSYVNITIADLSIKSN